MRQILWLCFLIAASISAAGVASAVGPNGAHVLFTQQVNGDNGDNGADRVTYQVTITNTTKGQTFSPPAVAAHRPEVRLFTLGEPASDPLRALAEDADYGLLTDLIQNTPQITGVTVATGPLAPGESTTVTLQAGPDEVISAIGMLTTTNDGFYAIDSVSQPTNRQVSINDSVAYDAGTEENNEQCGSIPGEPCNNPGVRAEANAEGFVHVHNGIHAVGDLDPSIFDWRNPVAKVIIERSSDQQQNQEQEQQPDDVPQPEQE